MIDTSKYEGHTEGPWMWYRDDGDVDLVVANDQCHTVLQEVKALYSEANEKDAPLLLEEVKRLRAWKKLVSDIVQQQDGSHLREMLKELIE
jgi:hypothetical protein